MGKNLIGRLDRLEQTVGGGKAKETDPAKLEQFLRVLDDWPEDLVLGEDKGWNYIDTEHSCTDTVEHLQSCREEVSSLRLSEIKQICRTLAARVRRGELSNTREIVSHLPDEALCGLEAEYRRIQATSF